MQNCKKFKKSDFYGIMPFLSLSRISENWCLSHKKTPVKIKKQALFLKLD
ncbi:hypothetical protein GTPT_2799 [Tatumella ptyseos ATCC 33301]|uniref:Uncharacterized protein n=1 Tax=Tatumella ptyseos ATCC 33301 TaxID=1005995 RepID=A0A085JC71_9GAMM|nr:hypothetical protein GTPT_2799 [Tatumella ptyseos ATCC 33301]